MAKRKETPDLLGELLGGAAPAPQPTPEVESRPEPVVAAEPSPAVEGALAPQPEPPPTGDPNLGPPAEAGPADVKPAPRRKASGRRASRQRRKTPVRWEYVEIVFCEHGGFRPRYINGGQVRNWKKAPLIYDYLNHLGEQGWELAAVGGRHKDRMPAYLKRPKA